MASYELFFNNNQLGDFNSNCFTNGYFGSQILTVNNNHPADRLIGNGAIMTVDDITGWRFTAEGDEEPGDNDVLPGAPMIVEYSTDGGNTWNNYAADIGLPDAEFYARQDEEGWMAIVAKVPGQPDGQIGFIAADAGVTPCEAFITDETVFERQVGEYALPCFGAGTMLLTEGGEIAVENLKVGDMVITRDNGAQPIRWISSRKLDAADLKAAPKLRPVRISAGALGDGLPGKDLYVSPQHRVLIRSKIAQRMFGSDEVLVAAKQLLALDGFDIAEEVTEAEYFHILLDRHEIVISNGAETESLYTGREALKAVGNALTEEIYTIFPELEKSDVMPFPARFLPTGRLARKMGMRHIQNAQPLVMKRSA